MNRRDDVCNIFIDFFGEDNVDFQSPYIIVHFPKVTVTNENNRSVDITHLWARVNINRNGTIEGYFQLIRSEYTLDQFTSGYSHSHIPSVREDNFCEWENPCLGSGPIRTTVSSLAVEYSEELWTLFCVELSKYVGTESVSGVPYMYLERIGVKNTSRVQTPIIRSSYMLSDLSKEIISKFMPYIIKKRPFKFNYIEGYNIAMSSTSIIITLSNLFIEWHNSLPKEQRYTKDILLSNNIMHKGICKGSQIFIYTTFNSSTSYDNIIGTRILTFKGKDICLNIIGEENPNSNDSLFLSINIVIEIIDRILQIVNYKYGKEN